MNYTDARLKEALAKMLPETCYMTQPDNKLLAWNEARLFPLLQPLALHGHLVLDTELLHLCWLVEENLDSKHNLKYYNQIELDAHASWQQRVEALAEVKGIKI